MASKIKMKKYGRNYSKVTENAIRPSEVVQAEFMVPKSLRYFAYISFSVVLLLILGLILSDFFEIDSLFGSFLVLVIFGLFLVIRWFCAVQCYKWSRKIDHKGYVPFILGVLFGVSWVILFGIYYLIRHSTMDTERRKVDEIRQYDSKKK